VFYGRLRNCCSARYVYIAACSDNAFHTFALCSRGRCPLTHACRRPCLYKNVEMYKIITNKHDSDVTLKFNIIPAAVTRDNIYKIRQDHVRYDLCKFSFSNGLRTLWNSLPDTVVKAESVNSFKGRLDRFWNDQKVNIIGKLSLRVPKAEVMYKFNLIILNFIQQFVIIPDI